MTQPAKLDKLQRIRDRAALYRQSSEAFAHWAAGFGKLRHDDLTQVRAWKMAQHLALARAAESPDDVYRLLAAADRLASAGLWLAAHMVYAQRVYTDGRDLEPDDFKTHPEGHLGGSLNMVLAYTGYLAVNALTGFTRSWIMGQGHTVSAIDAVNLLIGNMGEAHRQRYDTTDEGLSRFVSDFYLLRVRPDRYPESPIGSHVNANTAGGIMEGGYLGFAELYYVHMPLPGERLVAFLSDGAFEEQKGGDWAPRWWRAEDSGLVAPILIANGRRIDQRTTVSMQGGVDWFRDYQELNGFEPIDIDGRDPAAYAWAVLEMEERLEAHGQAVKAGLESYPVPLPYTIAEVPKGFGMPNAGTNLAHNLPLGKSPHDDEAARRLFNEAVRELRVPPEELAEAASLLKNHGRTRRPLERNHALATRDVSLADLPQPPWHSATDGQHASPMRAVDAWLPQIVAANPRLRPRVGNPDEMSSNRLSGTLDALKHRVTDPEPNTPEDCCGKVITALNEEAVVCAALANKGGISLVATYEAFAVKMLGAVRQELIFTRHLRDAARPAGWLSVPIFATSHTWENGKNELSHQDTTFAEALMNEMADVARVVFPADWNTALAALQAVYSSHGCVFAAVTPKGPVAGRFSPQEAIQLVRDGAVQTRIDQQPRLILSAAGAYQLTEAVKASSRLEKAGIPHNVNYLFEPARFRSARDRTEQQALADEDLVRALYPPDVPNRLFIVHTRPEPFAGVVRPLDTGPAHSRFLGFRNRGGTLDVFGMLYANQCTFAHLLAAAAELLDVPLDRLLGKSELDAVRRKEDPHVLDQPLDAFKTQSVHTAAKE